LCGNDDDDQRQVLVPSLISIMSAMALAYWKACSWYSSNMKTPCCSRVQKVVSFVNKGKNRWTTDFLSMVARWHLTMARTDLAL
jgi:hypothetical protein